VQALLDAAQNTPTVQPADLLSQWGQKPREDSDVQVWASLEV
jgi:hypothetical protein